MHRKFAFILLATSIGIPTAGFPQDALTILETMQQKQLERWEGVNDYMVSQSTMGTTVELYHQRTEVVDSSGDLQTFFLPISSNQRTTGSCQNGAVQMTPEDLEAFADAQEMTGAALGEEIENGLEQAGLPRGMLAGSGSSPTATFDPRVIMNANAEFLRAGAESRREQAQEGARNVADAEQSANHIVQFMQTATLIGSEQVGDRHAFHLHSDAIDQIQKSDGREYRMETMSIWIDQEHYVPVRLKIDGTMTSDSESQPMSIETMMTDFRQVPNSKMYESFKQTVQIAGVMSAEEEAEMQEAVAQLAELEQQMESMPSSQKQMMERMMGPQLEMIRNMAAGGGMVLESTIDSITINPPMVAEDGSACPTTSSSNAGHSETTMVEPTQSSSEIMAVDMTVMVQKDLTTLGYNPGNTDGEVTTETAIAISRFQAENDLEVTGSVTPQLAGILAAKSSRIETAPNSVAADPATLQAAQQACLQEKMAATQASQKKKRGLGRLMSGISRTAKALGGSDIAGDLSKTTGDLYTASATTDDFAAAAKDLGLTEDEIVECQNPM